MKNITNLGKVSVRAFILSLAILCVPLLTHAATLTRQLELGMTGSDVSSLQTFLAQDRTIYPQGLVTGYFGPLTQSAVSNFQAANGIATVGRVGPITLQAINAQMNGGVGSDKNSPMISSLTVDRNKTDVTIDWNTNENAIARVYYSTSPLDLTEASPTNGISISGNSFLVDSNLRSSHSANITGLKANTTYYYSAYVKDASGNEALTWPSTFKTLN